MPTGLALLVEESAGCTRCKLANLGRTQVVVSRGDPASDLMFVGEAPGAEEDKQGQPFVGRSGQLLDRLVLEEMGLGRNGFFVMNVVMCRPPGNRDPEADEITACRPWFDRKLELARPRVIVTLGNFSTKLLLGTTDGITKVRGRTYPFRGAALIPTFHPAAILRGGAEQMAQLRADLVRAKLLLVGAPAAAGT
ncbi:MAG: uracil-DNA glycosylase [Acidimicrobiales bacterium]